MGVIKKVRKILKTVSNRKKAANKRKAEANKYKRTAVLLGGTVHVKTHDDNIITVGHELGVHDKRGSIGPDQISDLIYKSDRNSKIKNNNAAQNHLKNLKVQNVFFKAFDKTQLPITIAKTGTSLGFVAASMIPLFGTHVLGAAMIGMIVTQLVLGIATNLNMRNYKFDSLNFFNIPIGVKNLEPKKEKQINKYLTKISKVIDDEITEIINDIEVTGDFLSADEIVKKIKKDKKKELNDFLKDVEENDFTEKEVVDVYSDDLSFDVCDLINENIKELKRQAREKLNNALNIILDLNYDEIEIINENIEYDILSNIGKTCCRNDVESTKLFHQQRINAKVKEYYETYNYDPEMIIYITNLLGENKDLFLDVLLGYIKIDMGKAFEIYDVDKNLSKFVVDEYDSFKTTLKDEVFLLIDNHISEDIDVIKNDAKNKMLSDSSSFSFVLNESDINIFYDMLSNIYKKMKYLINQEFRDRFKSITVDMQNIDREEYNEIEFDRLFFKILNGMIDLFSHLSRKIIVDEVNPFDKLRSFEIIKLDLESLYNKNVADSNSLLMKNIEKIDDYDIYDKFTLQDSVEKVLNLPNVNVGVYEDFIFRIEKEKEIIIENVVKIIQGFIEDGN